MMYGKSHGNSASSSSTLHGPCQAWVPVRVGRWYGSSALKVGRYGGRVAKIRLTQGVGRAQWTDRLMDCRCPRGRRRWGSPLPTLSPQSAVRATWWSSHLSMAGAYREGVKHGVSSQHSPHRFRTGPNPSLCEAASLAHMHTHHTQRAWGANRPRPAAPAPNDRWEKARVGPVRGDSRRRSLRNGGTLVTPTAHRFQLAIQIPFDFGHRSP